jgi:hypothetical protein
MHRRRRSPEPKPYRIAAQDDADEEGGTSYWLYDDLGRVLAGASWPQPLEEIARVVGHPVFRITYGGGVDDGDDN